MITYESLLRTNSIGCLTAVYDTQKIGKMYMKDIVLGQDYALWLAILKKIDYAYGIQEPLAKYRMTKGSLSGNKFRSAYWVWRLYRDVENLSLIKSSICFIQYTYHGLKDHILFRL
ncbi:MAG: Putative teichuronic acid biosynthesis glycosyltransferase TuaG [Catillopecten margaritatus gill symbiont]|uniref:Teichuronic acid biosynthesis glycosyltransferase TuaG n=1 Tax=Catillopecten margaritatus gill symbiont TaxID=3083288 RepID=A0AAU6PFW1_9GAMM